ncbi:MAG: hypothetical protein IKS07_05785, partial [Lachnospiraceae bacterium]|nr:hypothetical protein [Lachnospiraceae bacterium]
LCYFLEEGRCILVNHRMNEICRELFGTTLQNGASFYEAVKDRKIRELPDGTAVSFRHRVLRDRGEVLHELVADDITELYRKTEKLRRDNERAAQLAAGMRAYGENITDTVRGQEILQARANIHDEMNRMILMTKKSMEDPAGEEERRQILNMWKTQVLLLCKEADSAKSRNTVLDLNALASAIGLNVEWDGMPGTESTKALALFLAAAREAMTNASKHAQAGTIYIRVTEEAGALRAVFRNDGLQPGGPVPETGGLKNLRRRIESAGGKMETEVTKGYTLTVTIPKEE